MKVKVELDGRDSIEVEYEGEAASLGKLLRVSLVGCMEMMEMMQKMRRHFGADIKSWPVPEGRDHSSLLLRELILKLRGEWQFPYDQEELCHCRTIPTHIVDQAILSGAHTPEVVSRQTSASTACGTCRPDVQKIINYRLGVKAG
jgi:bacterioferritin-associated ferredoxin